MNLIQRFMREEEGQGLVEYALIIGLIAVLAIVALTFAGGKVSGMLGYIGDKMTTTGS